MKVLNWAGLVINGSVAFILPLILCSFFYFKKSQHHPDIHDVEISHSRIPKHYHDFEENSIDNNNINNNNNNNEENKSQGYQEKETILPNNNSKTSIPIEKSLPNWIIPYRWWIIHSIIFLFVVMIVVTIALDIITGNGP